MVPGPGLVALVKRRISCPVQYSNPRSIGRPARSLVTVLNTLSRTVPFSALVLAAYNNNRYVTVE